MNKIITTALALVTASTTIAAAAKVPSQLEKKEKAMCNVTIDFQKISNSEKITQDTNKVNFAGLDNSNNKK